MCYYVKQKGKEPIHWPLRCLRRYGFDAELFSFESGRRCPTGSGIYAFKCRHAEALFNLVQESIQRAGQEDQMRASGGSGSMTGPRVFQAPSCPSSRPASLAEPLEQYGFMVASNGSSDRQMALNDLGSQQHLYINGTVVPDSSHHYINTGLGGRSMTEAFSIDEAAPLIDFMNRPGQHMGPSGGRSQVNYAVLDLPSSMENLLDEDGQGAVHNFPRANPVCASHASAAAALNRLSMPQDLMGALGPEDIALQPADSDVFLSDGGDSAYNRTYININEPSPPMTRCSESSASEPAASGAGGTATGNGNSKPSGGLSVDHLYGPTANYANFKVHEVNGGLQQQARQQEPTGIIYIQLDLNQVPGSESQGQPGGNSISPTSPTSMVSISESPGYATIDFDRTEALSYSTRGGADGEDDPGIRKTRHNSTIGM